MSAGATACPLCGGPGRHVRTMPVDAKTFRPTPYGRVHRCTLCAFEYIAPRPRAADTARFYEIGGYYTQEHGQTPAASAPSPWGRARVHLAWRFDRGEPLVDVVTRCLPRSAALVDIGSGDGSQLAILARRGFRMTGVERDAKSVSRRTRVSVDRGPAAALPVAAAAVTVLAGSAEELPTELAHGSFDGVMFKQVLEHLVDPVMALRHAAVLLKPGGIMFVEVPNNACAIARRSGLAWEHMDVPRHLNFFDDASLCACIERAGLRVERVFFNEYCRYFADDYIALEQRIFDHLHGAQPACRYSAAASWMLLLRTLAASRRTKYDCVGAVAVKPM